MSTSTDLGLRLVITQPMLMPWHGFFSQMIMADRVIILDDVQLPQGRSFITRVQVKSPQGIDWLSVPVQRAGLGKQRICDVKVVENDWRSKHSAKIQQYYRKTPYFESVFEQIVQPVYNNHSSNLSDFLINSIKIINPFLGITKPIEKTSSNYWSSEFSGTDRLIEICRKAGASDYISGNGGMNYIDYSLFEDHGVKVNYMSYHLKKYNQLYENFIPYVSIIDLFFCVGIKNARNYLETKMVYWKDWPNKIDGRPTRMQ